MVLNNIALLRLGENPEQEVSWGVQDMDKVENQIHSGLLHEAAKSLSGKRVVIIVPAIAVVLYHLEIPIRNRQRLQSAIPYALEERLVTPIDQLHFSYTVLKQDRNNSVLQVAVVSGEMMEYWLQLLKENGIRSGQWVTEQQLFPHDDESEITIWADDNHYYISENEKREWLLVNGRDSLSSIVSLLSVNKKIIVWKSANTELSDNITYDHIQSYDDITTLFVDNWSQCSASTINLLQGRFSPGERWKQIAEQWKGVSFIFVLLCVVIMGLGWLELNQLKEQHKYYRDQVDLLYRSSFPDAKKVVNAKLQMERKLETLKVRKVEAVGALSSLSMIAAIVDKEILSSNAGKGSSLQVLNFKGGEFDLLVFVQSLQSLDRLKERLEDGTGYFVTIQNASSVEGRIEGRIKINTGKSIEKGK